MTKHEFEIVENLLMQKVEDYRFSIGDGNNPDLWYEGKISGLLDAVGVLKFYYERSKR